MAKKDSTREWNFNQFTSGQQFGKLSEESLGATDKNLECKVRFSLKECKRYFGNKNYCLMNLKGKKVHALAFYRKLGEIEKQTWQQFRTIRGLSFTPEISGSKSEKELKNDFPEISQFFHFRINGVDKNVFRIFGGKNKDHDICYILRVDINGKTHSKAHT